MAHTGYGDNGLPPIEFTNEPLDLMDIPADYVICARCGSPLWFTLIGDVLHDCETGEASPA